ncbi:MAG: DNA-processing protein DprA, partial [Deferribacterales bacterium]
MNNFDIISNYLSLLSIKGISHKTVVNLVRNLNTLGNIFRVESKFLKEAGLTDPQIDFIKSNKIDYKFVEQELELIKKYKINIITFEDENYPNLLKSIDDPPAILYTYGNIEALKQPSIAIVGSREASIPGCRFAKQLASDLAEIGFNIVSGFATGIDIHAHLGAMEKGLTTAIFGSGLLYVYPASNKKYLKKLYENGCIVSEQPLKEEPNAHNFPRRNRIISGLSLGVVVVEAHVKSGSLITARLAVEYGRDIFAVPIFPDHQNTGTNKLIKEGAKLIENYMDIVSEY